MSNRIFTGSDSLHHLFQFISSGSFSSVFVLVDENTLQHCYPVLIHQGMFASPAGKAGGAVIAIRSGEENKTLPTCETIWKKLTDENADRQSLLINLGGGVIGDLGGFAAGCYKRGIAFVNIPTTLLAMADASVGGKTGIDYLGFKNQIGLFNQPEAIFIYTGFLKTLPERDLVSGFAEVIKHYLIADKDALETLAVSHVPLAEMNWDEIIPRNIAIKSSIAAQDPLEQNIRKSLNFGHTIGHAVESYFLTDEHQRFLHGEAVAVGMICESFISMKLKLITETEFALIKQVILHYFRLPVLPPFGFKDMLLLLRQDKKQTSSKNQFTLLNGIGNYQINNYVEEAVVTESLNYYNTLLT